MDETNPMQQALQRLERADTNRLVDVLLNKNQHETMRFEALRQLLQRRDGEANEAIGNIIRAEDKHYELRLNAIWQAGWQRLSSEEVVDALVYALRDKTRRIRHSAADALGHIGEPSAIESLSAVLASDEADIKIKSSVLHSLGEFEPAAAHLPRLVEIFVNALQDTRQADAVRASAALNLGYFPNIRSVDTLSRTALDDDEPPQVRIAAIIGLERLARGQVERTPGQRSDLQASSSYILDPAMHSPDWEKVKENFKRYEHYLDSIREKLPQGARNYAFGPSHNCGDRQCPHDSWLENVQFEVRSSGEPSEYRQLDIHTRFLGSYHDGYIEFHYRNVRDYLLRHGGDWMYDEVRLGEEGTVIHEIRFLGDEHWLIECDDFTYEWKPFD